MLPIIIMFSIYNFECFFKNSAAYGLLQYLHDMPAFIELSGKVTVHA